MLETVQLNVGEGLNGLTGHQLAMHSGISVSIAKQRLLSCEKRGLICRDESVQGLSFFPNKFIC